MYIYFKDNGSSLDFLKVFYFALDCVGFYIKEHFINLFGIKEIIKNAMMFCTSI